MNLSPVQFYSYFMTFRGHEPKIVDRSDEHVLFVDEPWPSTCFLVLWNFWLFCSAFQFLGHLRKNVCLALGYCCSATQSCPAICDLMNCSTPVFPVYHHLLEFAQTPGDGDAIQPSHTLSSLLLLSSIFPCIRLFSNKSALHIRRPKYWSFSLSISPSMNIQDWFPSGMNDLISLQSKGL